MLLLLGGFLVLMLRDIDRRQILKTNGNPGVIGRKAFFANRESALERFFGLGELVQIALT